MPLKDIRGVELEEGDFVVYATTDCGNAKLRLGEVTGFGTQRYMGGPEIETIKVKPVDGKEVTLTSSARVAILGLPDMD